MGSKEHEFKVKLEPGAGIAVDDAWIAVRMRRDEVKGLDWAAVLRVRAEGRIWSVCVYDNAHGYPERHRIQRGKKLGAELLPTKGAARLDLPAAIAEIKANWRGWMERWER